MQGLPDAHNSCAVLRRFHLHLPCWETEPPPTLHSKYVYAKKINIKQLCSSRVTCGPRLEQRLLMCMNSHSGSPSSALAGQLPSPLLSLQAFLDHQTVPCLEHQTVPCLDHQTVPALHQSSPSFALGLQNASGLHQSPILRSGDPWTAASPRFVPLRPEDLCFSLPLAPPSAADAAGVLDPLLAAEDTSERPRRGSALPCGGIMASGFFPLALLPTLSNSSFTATEPVLGAAASDSSLLLIIPL